MRDLRRIEVGSRWKTWVQSAFEAGVNACAQSRMREPVEVAGWWGFELARLIVQTGFQDGGNSRLVLSSGVLATNRPSGIRNENRR